MSLGEVENRVASVSVVRSADHATGFVGHPNDAPVRRRYTLVVERDEISIADPRPELANLAVDPNSTGRDEILTTSTAA